jgi:small subunit ribosomal protein S15
LARLHSKKHGKSGSRRPAAAKAPSWVKYAPEEVTDLVEKLSKEGLTEPRIGQLLRDQYGIPHVKLVTGKTLTQILVEKGRAPQYPRDLLDLIKRAVNMRQHLKNNSRDIHNRTKLSHVESKIRRLVKYYRGRRLPEGWAYDPEQAALLVK